MGRNVFWGETSYLCFLTKKVGRNVFWGETSQGEMSWGEMSSGEKRPAPSSALCVTVTGIFSSMRLDKSFSSLEDPPIFTLILI